MGWTREPNAFFSFASYVPVDHKIPRQRPRFNYGHGFLRDLRNAGVHLKAWDITISFTQPPHEGQPSCSAHSARAPAPPILFRV